MEAWPGAPRGVKGAGEVGQRCGEGRGGERQRGGGRQGLDRGSGGRGSGGCADGDGDRLPHGWRRRWQRQSSLRLSGPVLGPCKQ